MNSPPSPSSSSQHASPWPGAEPSYAGTEDQSFHFDALSAVYDPEEPVLPSSPSSRSVDSLANATFSEVEARALEFLASSPPSDTNAVSFEGLANLPRKIPTLPTERSEAQAQAVEFLRTRLEVADRDDWIYPTPPAFLSPTARNTQDEQDCQPEMGWTDRAFNLDRYQEGATPDWHQEDSFVEISNRFGDAEGTPGWGST
ncbi:hypothetical protein JCM11641_006958 [Rhodosporidiobolus odoratus]